MGLGGISVWQLLIVLAIVLISFMFLLADGFA